MKLSPGQRVERYEILEQAGRGGAAVVYKARHTQLGTLHALKILTVSSEEIRRRMLREAQVQATLGHPGVVKVSDVLDIQGRLVLVLDFVDGPSMEAWINAGAIPLDEALRVFRQVVEAVAAAHEKGVVHRDLKPANVLMAEGNSPRVTDFGLAKVDLSNKGETRQGVAMGTPGYMAPELIENAQTADGQSDVFSLGCTLYALVCRRTPFVGKNLLDSLNRIAQGTYDPPRKWVPDLPDSVESAIVGALQVDRRKRIPDCETLLAVLDGQMLWDVEESETLLPLDLDPPTDEGPLDDLARELAAQPEVVDEEPTPLALERPTLQAEPSAPSDPGGNARRIAGALLILAGIALLVWIANATLGGDPPTTVIPEEAY